MRSTEQSTELADTGQSSERSAERYHTELSDTELYHTRVAQAGSLSKPPLKMTRRKNALDTLCVVWDTLASSKS